MGPKMKMLEHHSNIRPLRRKLEIAHPPAILTSTDDLTVQPYLSVRGGIEIIDCTQAGRFSRPAWSDESNTLSSAHGEGYTLQNGKVAVGFTKIDNLKKSIGGHGYLQKFQGENAAAKRPHEGYCPQTGGTQSAGRSTPTLKFSLDGV